MARIISWLLNFVYMTALVLCSPLILWQSLRTGKYREGFRAKFLGFVPKRPGSAPCVWIHAVSVGEVNLLATLLDQWREQHPDWHFVVSTTSRAGYELAVRKYRDLTVFYCPLDFSWAVRNAMKRIRPTMLVLAELELWPNLVTAANEFGARVAIVNGRLSDHSFPGYRRIRPIISWVLSRVDLVAAQNEESAARFRALGAPIDRVHVTGSLKYDGAQTDRSNGRTMTLQHLAGFGRDVVVFLAGSTQDPEEQIAIDIFRRLAPRFPRLRLVLVPRHPERFEAVATILRESGLRWRRRSELSGAPANSPLPADPQTPIRRTSDVRILLVDSVGELGAWWGAAHIAFVGGSFGSRGGQNMIEPAAYGCAVAFGPNTWNFRDIVASLLAACGAVVVNDAAELETFVLRCLSEPSFALSLGTAAQSLVSSQLGATRSTIEHLERIAHPRLRTAHCQRSAA